MKARPTRQDSGTRELSGGFRCLILSAALVLLLAIHSSAFGQAISSDSSPSGKTSSSSGLLRQFNDSLLSLTKQVTPAVVQIMVSSYGPVESGSRPGHVALFARQHDLGSGVILDPDGYIITNAHVVARAQRIKVALSVPDGSGPFDIAPASARRILDARLIGSDEDTDLALLKVEAHNLPVLNLAASRPVNTGQVVLAVGSPQGLQSSVTMGIVSSVWRQPDPDDPAVYIQTDAPINPGNSGGPLVDIDGYVIGLNTMILSEGGGSEGLGFAIPARTVQFVYDNLRKYGHVHRAEIKVSAQEITPDLAQGLSLAQDWGVIISNVEPDGPAAASGMKVGDIPYAVDGMQIAGLPGFSEALYLHSPDKPLVIDVRRGPEKVSLTVPVVTHQNDSEDLARLIDPQNLLSHLGVFVHDFDDHLRDAVPHVQISSGVVVLAQSPALNSYTSDLRAGDILHSVNNTPLKSVQQLRSMLREMKSGQAIALQIERAGRFQYISFEWGD